MESNIHSLARLILVGMAFGSMILVGCSRSTGTGGPPPTTPVGQVAPGMRRPGLNKEMPGVAPGAAGGTSSNVPR